MHLKRFYNLKSCILFFVVFSTVSWIVLELYLLSIVRKNEKGDIFNPNLFTSKLPQHTGLGKLVTVESAFEKLKKIHQQKLKQAGMKMPVFEKFNDFRNGTGNKVLKDSSILKKLKLIHHQKMNKAGFVIEAQGNLQKSVTVTDLLLALPQTLEINYNVHVFYYPWYGNPENDGRYFHWNHHYIPHWNKMESIKWPLGLHKPPEDIGANYYPLLGLYSSGDPKVVKAHMAQIQSTGAGVVVVSWYPRSTADKEGKEPDMLMPLILDSAQDYNLKVAFHIEPYKNRNHITLKQDLKYIMDSYGEHPAFYRMIHRGKYLPVYYIYDSYLVSSSNWSKILKPGGGGDSVRNTDLDGIFIGLLVELKHKRDLTNAGFDGFYTYFANNGFTYGSSWKHWHDIAHFARTNRLLFIPSVGPGYLDTRIRPWNRENTKPRDHGIYYEASFKSAMDVHPLVITVTSFNEWHEGTQIEPAIAKRTANYVYDDYQPEGPLFYLNLTRKWVDRFAHIQGV
ncbi:glycoprotein endo-alpha-1,2-mannosidase-like [Gigantopelta aegis]|uniref:glycoprotein endo-alpha-1,2-mannosidase-like n=1 Tax=Gigantopelta aegis TaxID=1735272 RepID=UPI001B88B199|nr:glycoprotein endo-alpha-1,2-mannosidase-like [Gigantopelta aegis]